MDRLGLLKEWYKSNCDGDWEHSYGIKIDTLDNPGWSIDIDLVDTILENKQFKNVNMYFDDNNWIDCKVENNIFKGNGSIDKLEEILDIFLEWKKL